MAKQKKRRSLIVGAINRFTAFIYSFFANGRIGEMLSSENTLCKRSYLANSFNKEKKKAQNVLLKYPETVMEQGLASRSIVFFRGFMASLKLNVYGMFFTFFGFASCIALMIPALIEGFSAINEYAIIKAAIITLCSIPMLFSSKSAAEALMDSKVMKRIVLDIMCIPPEKMKIQRRYGGTGYTFISAIVAMALGALSYFIDPMVVPIVFICLVAVLVIFSSPEAGVLITLALTPFLQYMSYPKMVLLIAILLTAISYFCKVFQRRRTLSLSPEISMVLLFCGFILVAGAFSAGGLVTMLDSFYSVVIILGGFMLTYNLINTQKMLSACLKTLTVSFLFLCMMGIWESVLYGISNRIIDSVNPNISQITGENVFYIADKGIIFGLFAVLLFPMLFSYMINRKTAKGRALVVIFGMITVIAAWMCSHYEIIVALALECVLFWFFYSHKTMTAVIIASIPVAIIALLYPYAIRYWNFPDISSILMEYMPASISASKTHIAVIGDVIEMLKDGNILGIGAGDHAFAVIFPAYSSEASRGAEHPMSLWLQVLCWSGIFGFVAFMIFVVFLVKRSLGFIRSNYNKELRAKAMALFSGIIVAFLFGSVYSIWVDEKVLYLFWACVGLLMSYVRLGKKQESVRWGEFRSGQNEKDVELVFYN